MTTCQFTSNPPQRPTVNDTWTESQTINLIAAQVRTPACHSKCFRNSP